MNNAEFWKWFWGIMGPAILALLTWVGNSVKGWLKNKIKTSKYNTFLGTINDIVFNAIYCVSQTYVDDLKKDGKFDKEAQQIAKEKAYAIICTQLTPQLQKFIQENFVDVKEFIMNLIEAKICISKNQ